MLSAPVNYSKWIPRGLIALICTCLITFSTVGFAAQSRIVLDNPHGGEIYLAGQTQTVHVISALKLLQVTLSRDGGQTFEPLGSIDASSRDISQRNSLTWQVALPASNACVIRVTNGVFSATSGMFSIAAPNADGTNLGGASLAPGSVGVQQLADGAVTTPKLADAAVTSLKISSGQSSSNFVLLSDGAGGADWSMLPAASGVTSTSGDNLIVALNNGATASTINASRLDPNVALKNARNTFTSGQNVQTGADAAVGLVIRGNSPTQSADLQQWQDSTGAVKAFVSSLGVFHGNGLTVTGSVTLPSQSVADSALSTNIPLKNTANTFTSGTQTVQTGADATVGIVVKGNSPTQSADLQQWQDSTSAVTAFISSLGVFNGNGSGLSSLNGSNITSGTVPPAQLPIAGTTSGTVGGVYADNATIIVGSDGRITAIGAAPSGFAGGDLSGSYPFPTIASSVITGSKIASGTITGRNLAGNIGISTTGNIATTSDGTITSSGVLTASGGLTVTGSVTLPANSIANGALSSNVVLNNQANTFNTGTQTVQTGGDAVVGVVIKGNSPTQSADLQQWQDSTGAVKASLSSSGVFSGNGSGLSNLNATTLTGTVALANGGTGAATQQNAINALAGGVTSGQFLRGNGTNVLLSAIQAADVPTLNQNTTGTAANVTGTVAIGNGGTGAATQQNAINALAGGVTSGQFLRGNGTNVLLSAIQAADVPTLNQNTTGTAANVTGIVAVANGGTGASSLGTSKQPLLGNGTSAVTAAGAPTTNDTLADIIVGTSATTQKALVLQGKASQSASLQEWQDSTGAVKLAVSAAGVLSGNGSGLTSLNAGNISSGVAPIANGGTGSNTQNFVDLTTNQTGIAGNKTLTGVITFSRNGAGTGDYSIGMTGTPVNDATSSLVRVGGALASGNSAANGGTYIGLNAPGSGAGSAADLMNLQVNGASKLKVSVSNTQYNHQYYSNRYDNGSSGTALTVDFNNANCQVLTLSGNCTLTLNNPQAGGRYILELKQDASGSRTVTWPATVKWSGGVAPTLTTTASQTDIITPISMEPTLPRPPH